MYYAHSTDKQDKSDWQPLKSHLENVADIARGFAKEFAAESFGYAAGLFHDIGKYSPEFQRRLAGANIKVDHSTAGAQETRKIYNGAQSRILEYIITGHHGGMPDFENPNGGLQDRLLKKQLPDYSAYKNEIIAPDLNGIYPRIRLSHGSQGFSVSFYIRMLFSCVVDADFLDTEKVLKPNKSLLRGKYDSFTKLSRKFDEHMDIKLAKAKKSPINGYRKDIYEQCRKKANLPQQMFSLTVPTGGGKTLSSMAFALDHLKMHDLNRIFYVIPYTSIIEQTADVFRGIFGAQNVLEHHSNYDPVLENHSSYDPESEDTENIQNIQEKLKLSSENWDMPIVVTTNVQFFESLFSNHVSRCRKLHNLAKSVIILDEAQMLPTGFLKPCLAALSELVANYGTTVVLCTATQPNLDGLLDARVKPLELMNAPEALYEAFKRVNVTDLGDISDTDLSAKLNAHNQVLCIVNTRKHALKLYEQLSKSNNRYHLSSRLSAKLKANKQIQCIANTRRRHAQNLYGQLSKISNCCHLSARMCPAHRRKVLNEIKARLKAGAECRVVSTSLIGVGVDIDFPFVYEEKCGIDSACQGAGRCNREGKRDYGEVYVFRSTEDFKMVPWQRRVAEIGSMIFDAYPEDPLSLPAVNEYFKELYFYEGAELDRERILPALEESPRHFEFPFEVVANAFKFIQENTQSIIIPYDENARFLLKKVQQAEFPGGYLRSLQGYTVNIYLNEFEALIKSNAIYSIADRFFVLKEGSEYYSEEVGLISQLTSLAQASKFLYL